MQPSMKASLRFLNAAKKGDVRTLEDCLWLEHVDACDPRGYTAVHVAAQTGNEKALKFLIGKGASVHLRTTQLKLSALHLCKSGAVAQLLLDAGADPRARNSQKQTPLQAFKAARMMSSSGRTGRGRRGHTAGLAAKDEQPNEAASVVQAIESWMVAADAAAAAAAAAGSAAGTASPSPRRRPIFQEGERLLARTDTVSSKSSLVQGEAADAEALLSSPKSRPSLAALQAASPKPRPPQAPSVATSLPPPHHNYHNQKYGLAEIYLRFEIPIDSNAYDAEQVAETPAATSSGVGKPAQAASAVSQPGQVALQAIISGSDTRGRLTAAPEATPELEPEPEPGPGPWEISIPESELKFSAEDDVIGMGGQGVVYRAQWQHTTVAVKQVIIGEDRAREDAKNVADLRKEGRLLS
jgi:hypothetical protein